MKFTIDNHQLGLLYKNGSYKKCLLKGRYNFSKLFGYSVKIIDKREQFENNGLDIALFSFDTKLMSMLEVVKIKNDELAFHFINDIFSGILTSGVYSFFQDVKKNTFRICDITNYEIPQEINKIIYSNDAFLNTYKAYISKFVVKNGYEGALFYNGSFVKTLSPQSYYFFNVNQSVELKEVDMKTQVIQVTGQEILTTDQVDLRINFAVTFKIIDSVKVLTKFKDYSEQLYLLFQFALREYLSTRTLNDILTQKDNISKIILTNLKLKEETYGVEFISAGIKDTVLPGDIKAILNEVLKAEKKAYANVITRREETASTRSLLNTAKLMDENATLYKLKELEYLERIFEKVGSLSLSNNGNVIEQLSQLIKK